MPHREKKDIKKERLTLERVLAFCLCIYMRIPVVLNPNRLPSEVVHSIVRWRKYPSHMNCKTPSLERIIHLSVVVPSRGKQTLSSYSGQIGLWRNGCSWVEGRYHIGLDDSAKPIQHAPQRCQVALRDKIKEILEELHNSGVIEPVSRPMPWILSMLAFPKKEWRDQNMSYPNDLN